MSTTEGNFFSARTMLCMTCGSYHGLYDACEPIPPAALDAIEHAVSHPKHYTSHPSGVECIAVTEHFNFNLGNAIKYIWRAGLKNADALTDLKKAQWYVEREIARLQK